MLTFQDTQPPSNIQTSYNETLDAFTNERSTQFGRFSPGSAPLHVEGAPPPVRKTKRGSRALILISPETNAPIDHYRTSDQSSSSAYSDDGIIIIPPTKNPITTSNQTSTFTNSPSETSTFTNSFNESSSFINSMSERGNFVNSMSERGNFMNSMSERGNFVNSMGELRGFVGELPAHSKLHRWMEAPSLNESILFGAGCIPNMDLVANGVSEQLGLYLYGAPSSSSGSVTNIWNRGVVPINSILPNLHTTTTATANCLTESDSLNFACAFDTGVSSHDFGSLMHMGRNYCENNEHLNSVGFQQSESGVPKSSRLWTWIGDNNNNNYSSS